MASEDKTSDKIRAELTLEEIQDAGSLERLIDIKEKNSDMDEQTKRAFYLKRDELFLPYKPMLLFDTSAAGFQKAGYDIDNLMQISDNIYYNTYEYEYRKEGQRLLDRLSEEYVVEQYEKKSRLKYDYEQYKRGYPNTIFNNYSVPYIKNFSWDRFDRNWYDELVPNIDTKGFNKWVDWTRDAQKEIKTLPPANPYWKTDTGTVVIDLDSLSSVKKNNVIFKINDAFIRKNNKNGINSKKRSKDAQSLVIHRKLEGLDQRIQSLSTKKSNLEKSLEKNKNADSDQSVTPRGSVTALGYSTDSSNRFVGNNSSSTQKDREKNNKLEENIEKLDEKIVDLNTKKKQVEREKIRLGETIENSTNTMATDKDDDVNDNSGVKENRYKRVFEEYRDKDAENQDREIISGNDGDDSDYDEDDAEFDEAKDYDIQNQNCENEINKIVEEQDTSTQDKIKNLEALKNGSCTDFDKLVAEAIKTLKDKDCKQKIDAILFGNVSISDKEKELNKLIDNRDSVTKTFNSLTETINITNKVEYECQPQAREALDKLKKYKNIFNDIFNDDFSDEDTKKIEMDCKNLEIEFLKGNQKKQQEVREELKIVARDEIEKEFEQNNPTDIIAKEESDDSGEEVSDNSGYYDEQLTLNDNNDEALSSEDSSDDIPNLETALEQIRYEDNLETDLEQIRYVDDLNEKYDKMYDDYTDSEVSRVYKSHFQSGATGITSLKQKRKENKLKRLISYYYMKDVTEKKKKEFKNKGVNAFLEEFIASKNYNKFLTSAIIDFLLRLRPESLKSELKLKKGNKADKLKLLLESIASERDGLDLSKKEQYYNFQDRKTFFSSNSNLDFEDEMSDVEYEAYSDEDLGEWKQSYADELKGESLEDCSSDTGSYMSD